MNNLPPDSNSEESISLEQDLALSGEDPDAFYEEERRNMQRDSDIDKLSHRMTLLFILIPSLLCAVFAFAYMDVREKLNQLESMGSKRVEELSVGVVEKAATLSQKFEALEKSLGQRLSILKDASIAVQDKVKRNEKRIEQLADSSVDKKSYAKAAKAGSAELATAMAAVKKDMATQQSAIEELSKQLQKELDREANAITAFQSDLREQDERFAKADSMIEALQKKALKLELGIKKLADVSIDNEMWKKAMERTARLEKKAKDLAEELSWLEETLNVTRETRPTKEVEATKPKDEKAGKSTASPITPGSGQIIEQEIKE